MASPITPSGAERGAVLVTGGAGYIGSHACKALAAEGRRYVAYDNLSTGHRGAVGRGDLVVADILDAAALRQVVRDYRVSAVMHFAALASVGDSVKDPSPVLPREPRGHPRAAPGDGGGARRSDHLLVDGGGVR